MRLSGHKTRSVFDRHNIVSDADLRVAPEKLSAYLDQRISENSHNLATIGDFQMERASSKKSQIVRNKQYAPVAQ